MFSFGLVPIWLTVSLSVTALIMVLMGHGTQIGACAYEMGRRKRGAVLGAIRELPSVKYKLGSKNADKLRANLTRLPNEVLKVYFIFMCSWTWMCFYLDTSIPGSDLVRLHVWWLALTAIAAIATIVIFANYFFGLFIKALSSGYNVE